MIDTQVDAYAEANQDGDVAQFSPPHEAVDLPLGEQNLMTLNKSPIYEQEEFSENNAQQPENMGYNIDLFQQEKSQQEDQEMKHESASESSSSESSSSSIEQD